MWELDYKESSVPNNWCFWTVVLEKTLESPLDCKEIKPVNPKGNQSWIFIGKTDAEAEILWPPDAKNWLLGKDPDSGKDWKHEKRTTEDEMASLTRWTWVWASSGSWWWTGTPGMLQSMELQSQTQLNWIELMGLSDSDYLQAAFQGSVVIPLNWVIVDLCPKYNPSSLTVHCSVPGSWSDSRSY